jgi:hypothetical protein
VADVFGRDDGFARLEDFEERRFPVLAPALNDVFVVTVEGYRMLETHVCSGFVAYRGFPVLKDGFWSGWDVRLWRLDSVRYA